LHPYGHHRLSGENVSSDAMGAARPSVHAHQPSRHLDRWDRVYAVRDLRSAIRAFAPFSAAAVLAWTGALIGSRVHWGQYALSILLALIAGTLAIRATRERERDRSGLGLVPAALLFLAGVAFLRNSVGGSTSGTCALAMIPVFHTALYTRSRRQLTVVVAGVGLFYLLPILIVGAPTYPQSQYRSAVLSVAVSAIIG